MKKILSIGLILVLLSGCGSTNKVLSCKQTLEDMDPIKDVSMIANLHYNGSDVARLDMIQNMTLEDEQLMTDTTAYLDEVITSLKEVKGFNYSYKINGTKLVVTAKIDFKTMSDGDLEKTMTGVTTAGFKDIETASASLVGIGYTCPEIK